MINQARTLLLNRDGSKRPGIVLASGLIATERSSFFMEEYVPPAFRPIPLPSTLAYVHTLLFGQTPDDAYANFRVAQFMRILHSTEFVEYALALDPRVTYFANDDVVALEDIKHSQQISLLGTPIPSYVNGEVQIHTNTPRLANDWIVEAVSTNVTRAMHSQTGLTAETTLTFPGSTSSLIDLPTQSALKLRLSGLDNLTTGMQWQVSTFNKPVDDLSDLLSTLVAQSHNLAPLFEGEGNFKIFKQLWERHLLLPYRLSGLLLAFIYSVEGLRHG